MESPLTEAPETRDTEERDAIKRLKVIVDEVMQSSSTASGFDSICPTIVALRGVSSSGGATRLEEIEKSVRRYRSVCCKSCDSCVVCSLLVAVEKNRLHILSVLSGGVPAGRAKKALALREWAAVRDIVYPIGPEGEMRQAISLVQELLCVESGVGFVRE